jgi:arginase
MALAIPLGLCWRGMAQTITGLQPLAADSVCLYGARMIDPGERMLIEAESIPVVHDAAGAVAALDACGRVYLHLDMDVHDPAVMRANSYISPGGPAPKALREDLMTITRELPVAALTVTGVDPAVAESGPAIPCAIEHIIAVCQAQKAM